MEIRGQTKATRFTTDKNRYDILIDELIKNFARVVYVYVNKSIELTEEKEKSHDGGVGVGEKQIHKV